MLRTILSITGKPGLFKIVSQGKNMLLIEDLQTKKRQPAHSRDKIISLGDIAMYTIAEEVPLSEVLDKVYAHEDGKAIDVKALVDSKSLRSHFEAILPDFDQDRVYDNDIKKLFSWYNILVSAGFTKFTADEEDESVAETENTESEKA